MHECLMEKKGKEKKEYSLLKRKKLYPTKFHKIIQCQQETCEENPYIVAKKSLICLWLHPLACKIININNNKMRKIGANELNLV